MFKSATSSRKDEDTETPLDMQNSTAETAKKVPEYLDSIYNWAYLNPKHMRFLDKEIVVRTILWQQHRKLERAAFCEIEPGQRVLQPACV